MKHTQFAVLLAALLAFTACNPEPQIITQTVPEYVTAVRGTDTYTVYHLQHKVPASYTDTENPASPENYEVVKDDTQEKELSEGSAIDDIKNDYPGFSAVSMTQNGNAIYVYYDRNTITYTFKAGQPEDSDVKGTFAGGTTEKKLSGLFGEAVEFDPPEVPNCTHEVKGWKPELPSTFGAENTEFTAVWGPPLTISNGVLIKCNPNVKGPVTIPDGVTSIGYNAFKDCIGLTAVTIPESVMSIGSGAFRYCSSLTSVNIPASVSSIGDCAFSGCSSLTSVTIPEGVSSIGDSAFWACSELTSVTIPASVSSIGDSAFWACSELTSVTIPASVSSIGDSAFEYCSSLATVEFKGTTTQWAAITKGNSWSYQVPATTVTCSDGTADLNYTLTIDENGVLTKCTGSANGTVIIPEGVKSIGDYAFYNCSSLTSVTIPASVSSIGRDAFADCRSLTSVSIPEGVMSIGEQAFSDCSSLTSVNIPDGVTSIGASAFSGCSSLTSVTIPASVSSIEYNAFSDCSNLTSVTISEGVTSIGERAFYNCSNLTSVTIPASVTSIGDWAFSWCSSLTTVNYNGTTAQWAAITKVDYWSYQVPATTVMCSNGSTSL